MPVTDSRVRIAAARRTGSLALSTLGLLVGLLGAAWWAFDAGPRRGQVLLVIGATLAIAGRAIAQRLSPGGQRILLIVVSVAAVLVLIDAVHLIQVVDDQRASHLG
jgi:hypothetical protein